MCARVYVCVLAVVVSLRIACFVRPSGYAKTNKQTKTTAAKTTTRTTTLTTTLHKNVVNQRARR